MPRQFGFEIAHRQTLRHDLLCFVSSCLRKLFANRRRNHICGLTF